MANDNPKRKGVGLEIKSFNSIDGKNEYMVYKTIGGGYHVFVEVEAKQAAINCGSKIKRKEITRKHWDKLWEVN